MATDDSKLTRSRLARLDDALGRLLDAARRGRSELAYRVELLASIGQKLGALMFVAAVVFLGGKLLFVTGLAAYDAAPGAFQGAWSTFRTASPDAKAAMIGIVGALLAVASTMVVITVGIDSLQERP